MQASPLFSIDDDAPDSSGSQSKHKSEHAIETFDLLSVNQLLESVCFHCMFSFLTEVASACSKEK